MDHRQVLRQQVITGNNADPGTVGVSQSACGVFQIRRSHVRGGGIDQIPRQHFAIGNGNHQVGIYAFRCHKLCQHGAVFCIAIKPVRAKQPAQCLIREHILGKVGFKPVGPFGQLCGGVGQMEPAPAAQCLGAIARNGHINRPVRPGENQGLTQRSGKAVCRNPTRHGCRLVGQPIIKLAFADQMKGDGFGCRFGEFCGHGSAPFGAMGSGAA